MNRRLLLVIAALLLVGGGIALLLAVRGDGDGGGGERDRGGGGSATSRGGDGGGPTVRLPGDAGVRGRPPRGDGDGDGEPVVRDHRDPDRPDAAVRERADAGPELRDVEPAVTANARLALRPVLKRCLGEIDPSALLDHPTLTATVKVHVAAEKMVIDEVSVDTSDVVDPHLSDCVVKAATGLTLAAKGHRDVAATTMKHGFDLRAR